MESVGARRIEQVRKRMVEAAADRLLVAHPPNIYYLSGFSGSSGALLIETGRVSLFTDGRYGQQARAETRGVRIHVSRQPWPAAVGESLRAWRNARVAFESARLSVAELAALRRASGTAVRWVPMDGLIEALRGVKSRDELALMRQAARLGSEVFLEVLPLVKPGVRELELAAEIDYRLRRLGANGPAFETIIASGERSALPHARPSDKPLRKNELVVFDLGAILRHYCCDLTRTVYLGRAPSRIRRWYQAVREAQTEALDTLRAGVAAGEVDAAARGVLRRYGLERCFAHSTGHGLGLEVHEEPRLARGQKQRIVAGNVVTLEPGVYVPGVGGIRLEDDVAVLPGRTEILTSAPREFLEL